MTTSRISLNDLLTPKLSRFVAVRTGVHPWERAKPLDGMAAHEQPQSR